MYSNGFEVFVTSDKFCAGSQLGIYIFYEPINIFT